MRRVAIPARTSPSDGKAELISRRVLDGELVVLDPEPRSVCVVATLDCYFDRRKQERRSRARSRGKSTCYVGRRARADPSGRGFQVISSSSVARSGSMCSTRRTHLACNSIQSVEHDSGVILGCGLVASQMAQADACQGDGQRGWSLSTHPDAPGSVPSTMFSGFPISTALPGAIRSRFAAVTRRQ